MRPRVLRRATGPRHDVSTPGFVALIACAQSLACGRCGAPGGTSSRAPSGVPNRVFANRLSCACATRVLPVCRSTLQGAAAPRPPRGSSARSPAAASSSPPHSLLPILRGCVLARPVAIPQRHDRTNLRLALRPGVEDSIGSRERRILPSVGRLRLPDRPDPVDHRVVHPEERISRRRGNARHSSRCTTRAPRCAGAFRASPAGRPYSTSGS